MASPHRKPLGDLESALLAVLWDSRATLSVRDVLLKVKREPALAYTTVMTVLDRLHDKGLVAREKHGKAFMYWPRVSREAYFGEQAARMLTEADGPVQNEVLMAFLDSAQQADPKVLDQLSQLIDARRKRGSR